MHVILSFFDQLMGPRYLLTSHPHLAKFIENSVIDLMDLKKDDGFFVFHDSNADELVLVNNSFEIPSAWSRGTIDRLMVTVVTDPIQNPSIFKPHIAEFVKQMQTIPNLYKGLHPNHSPPNSEYQVMADRIQDLFNDLLGACTGELQDIGLGAILVLGVSKAGKTSFLHAINRKVFNPSQRPTLGVNIARVVLESYYIKAFDVGGQTKLRNFFSRVLDVPKGIIFIVDVNATESVWDESKELFEQIYTHFSSDKYKNPEDSHLFSIPMLVMGNKIDLGSSVTEEDLDNTFKLHDKDLNCHIGLCSALKNEGVVRNFRWLVRQILERTFSDDD